MKKKEKHEGVEAGGSIEHRNNYKVNAKKGLQQMLDIACICTIFTYKSTMTTTKLRINITKTLRLKIL
ncbi:hypothetical protein HUJ05_009776 [Dendroctonus ponderosae]|nr:hypothetical protein HUJ05_009776 [Dendroctonus ponderosae]